MFFDLSHIGKEIKGKMVYKENFHVLSWAPRDTQVFEGGELWMGLGLDYELSGLNFKFHTRALAARLNRAGAVVVGVGRTAIYIFIENLFIFIINNFLFNYNFVPE